MWMSLEDNPSFLFLPYPARLPPTLFLCLALCQSFRCILFFLLITSLYLVLCRSLCFLSSFFGVVLDMCIGKSIYSMCVRSTAWCQWPGSIWRSAITEACLLFPDSILCLTVGVTTMLRCAFFISLHLKIILLPWTHTLEYMIELKGTFFKTLEPFSLYFCVLLHCTVPYTW